MSNVKYAELGLVALPKKKLGQKESPPFERKT